MPEGKVRAAYEGNRIAQYQIGQALENGLYGLPISDILAIRWFQLADKNNHKQAKAALKRVKDRMSKEDIAFAISNQMPPGPDGADWDDVLSGDLDGYLLIGSDALLVDGAYLPRNYDNDSPGQDADLPLRSPDDPKKS